MQAGRHHHLCSENPARPTCSQAAVLPTVCSSLSLSAFPISLSRCTTFLPLPRLLPQRCATSSAASLSDATVSSVRFRLPFFRQWRRGSRLPHRAPEAATLGAPRRRLYRATASGIALVWEGWLGPNSGGALSLFSARSRLLPRW